MGRTVVSGKQKYRGLIALPFVDGVSNELERVLRKTRIATAPKPHVPLWRLLVYPKDKLEPGLDVYTIGCSSCEKTRRIWGRRRGS